MRIIKRPASRPNSFSKRYKIFIDWSSFRKLVGCLVKEKEGFRKALVRKTEEAEYWRTKALTDPLTQVNNRLSFNEHIIQVFQDSIESSLLRSQTKPVSMIMLDIDKFKDINDTYGHSVGDQVLRDFASVCNNVSQADIFARNGGEEFVSLLPNTDFKKAADIAETMRMEVSLNVKVREDGHAITASFGVSEFNPCTMVNCIKNEIKNGSGVEEVVSMLVQAYVNQLIEESDKALYESKKQGRNRVTVMTSEGFKVLEEVLNG